MVAGVKMRYCKQEDENSTDDVPDGSQNQLGESVDVWRGKWGSKSQRLAGDWRRVQNKID